MTNFISTGVWATMVTPFSDSGETIDYPALEKLVEWYIENGVSGLFAVCNSSESFLLSPEERLSLASFVVDRVRGRIPVIAGGTYGADASGYAREIETMADTGVSGVVILSSMLAAKEEGSDVWRKRLDDLLSTLSSSIPLGIYESPSPYHRILSVDDISWCGESDRFLFLKDTSCDIDTIRQRLAIMANTGFRHFNANSETFLDSLRLGASGYSSIMANVNPYFYEWLLRNYRENPDQAEHLQSFLAVADAAVVSRCYPTSAKHYLSLEGVPISLATRTKTRFPPDSRMFRAMERLQIMNREYRERIGI